MARATTNSKGATNGKAATNGKSNPSRNIPDALALLRADHKAVHEMFKEYNQLCSTEDSDAEQKQELATRICAELTVHATIEEEILYPALRGALDEQDILDEAEVEHASAKDLIRQLQDMDAGDDLFDAKVIVLGEYINHHVDEEQGEMFKQAKTSGLDLQALGEQLFARQQELKGEMGLDEMDDSDKAKADVRKPPRGGSRNVGNRHAA